MVKYTCQVCMLEPRSNAAAKLHRECEDCKRIACPDCQREMIGPDGLSVGVFCAECADWLKYLFMRVGKEPPEFRWAFAGKKDEVGRPILRYQPNLTG